MWKCNRLLCNHSGRWTSDLCSSILLLVKQHVQGIWRFQSKWVLIWIWFSGFVIGYSNLSICWIVVQSHVRHIVRDFDKQIVEVCIFRMVSWTLVDALFIQTVWGRDQTRTEAMFQTRSTESLQSRKCSKQEASREFLSQKRRGSYQVTWCHSVVPNEKNRVDSYGLESRVCMFAFFQSSSISAMKVEVKTVNCCFVDGLVGRTHWLMKLVRLYGNQELELQSSHSEGGSHVPVLFWRWPLLVNEPMQ